jgi:hypothetical protein
LTGSRRSRSTAFLAATDAAYASVLPRSAARLRWLFSDAGGFLILPQSILLGTTFPLMSAGLIRRYPLAPGESLAMLYFTNSFGAAVGVLASGFVMIEKLGLPGTVQTAGVMNLALAAVVWILARGSEPPMAVRPGGAADSSAEAPFRVFIAVAFLSGAASFVFEIGWIRMLSLVLGASTHSFELMLSAFILGRLRLLAAKADRRDHRPRQVSRRCPRDHGLLALATLPLYGQMSG